MEYWSGWFDVWGDHHHVFHAEGIETLFYNNCSLELTHSQVHIAIITCFTY